jgi:hypothetical protein
MSFENVIFFGAGDLVAEILQHLPMDIEHKKIAYCFPFSLFYQ